MVDSIRIATVAVEWLDRNRGGPGLFSRADGTSIAWSNDPSWYRDVPGFDGIVCRFDAPMIVVVGTRQDYAQGGPDWIFFSAMLDETRLGTNGMVNGKRQIKYKNN